MSAIQQNSLQFLKKSSRLWTFTGQDKLLAHYWFIVRCKSMLRQYILIKFKELSAFLQARVVLFTAWVDLPAITREDVFFLSIGYAIISIVFEEVEKLLTLLGVSQKLLFVVVKDILLFNYVDVFVCTLVDSEIPINLFELGVKFDISFQLWVLFDRPLVRSLGVIEKEIDISIVDFLFNTILRGHF